MLLWKLRNSVIFSKHFYRRLQYDGTQHKLNRPISADSAFDGQTSSADLTYAG